MHEPTQATAYIKAGRLCVIGLHECELGPVPFSYSTAVEEGTPEGPIDLGDDKLDPKVTAAIDAAQEPLMQTIEKERMKLGAESLVERARQGDQNAMGMIAAVREQAGEGNERAKTAVGLLHEYIAAHPVESSERRMLPVPRQMAAHLREDGPEPQLAAIQTLAPAAPDIYVAALVIADGPPIGKEKVDTIAAGFGEDLNPAFTFGVRYFNNPDALNVAMAQADEDERRALFSGQAVGLAWTLQGLRSGRLPIRAFCPVAGWELE